jgi:ATP-binding cassette subfamily B protein
VEDSLLGIRVVKSFANEEIENKKFGKANEKFLSIKARVYRVMGGFHASTRLFDGLMYIVVVIAGALFMLEGHISSADFVAYLLFVSTLIASIRRIVEFTEQFQRGMTGIERFCEIMDTEPEIQNHKNAEELGKVEGNVSFRDVSFRYETEHQNVLTKLSLEIKAGESVDVQFEIREPALRFWNARNQLISEAGEFELFVGYADHRYICDEFTLVK